MPTAHLVPVMAWACCLLLLSPGFNFLPRSLSDFPWQLWVCPWSKWLLGQEESSSAVLHRITEYAQLEGSSDCVQLLALQGIPQPSHLCLTLLRLRQLWGCDPVPGDLVQCQTTLWVKNLS